MSNPATIPLAKGFKPEKLQFPVYLSIKYDGVPVKITVKDGYKCTAVTRQNKPVPSISEYLRKLSGVLQQNRLSDVQDYTFVAEITHETLTAFKDISGLVRKQFPQTGFIFNIFDYVDNSRPSDNFQKRNLELRDLFLDNLGPSWRIVSQVPVFDYDDLTFYIEHMMETHKNIEGLVARSYDAEFKPNSRHWDYQKIVHDPTVDLRIIGYVEAVSKEGEPKGMVGSLVAEYKDTIIYPGAGKMKHKERIRLWDEYVNNFMVMTTENDIATIQFKKDDSYTSLRQPTFQHWRPEKTEESYD